MDTRKSSKLISIIGILVLLFTPYAGLAPIATVSANNPDPTSVTIAGSLQSELGCPGDWQPDCAATHLAYDSNDDVWQGTFSVPAGSWEYKAALNDTAMKITARMPSRVGPTSGFRLGRPAT